MTDNYIISKLVLNEYGANIASQKAGPARAPPRLPVRRARVVAGSPRGPQEPQVDSRHLQQHRPRGSHAEDAASGRTTSETTSPSHLERHHVARRLRIQPHLHPRPPGSLRRQSVVPVLFSSLSGLPQVDATGIRMVHISRYSAQRIHGPLLFTFRYFETFTQRFSIYSSETKIYCRCII